LPYGCGLVLSIEFIDVPTQLVKNSKDCAKPGLVVIVDDNPDDVRLTELIIAKCYPGLCIRAVNSGEELTCYLEGVHGFSDRKQFPYPTMILLDVNMPRMNGFDVLQWLRAHPPHNHIPTIILTVPGDLDLVKKAYGLGARSFLTKPLIAGEFVNAILGFEDWLERVQASVTQVAELSTPEMRS
jgi:CheY-like chemotaxis protein